MFVIRLIYVLQSEEDKQLQEELNMLVERLQVLLNLFISSTQNWQSYIKVMYLPYSLSYPSKHKKQIKVNFV